MVFVIHQTVWRRFECRLKSTINFNFSHKCPPTPKITRDTYGMIHSHVFFFEHSYRVSATFCYFQVLLSHTHFLDRQVFFFHPSLSTIQLTLCPSSPSDLTLQEKLFYGSNTQRRREWGKGIDKFLLFTCFFMESNYEEGDFDEGKQ